REIASTVSRPRSPGKETDMRASFYEGSRTFRTGPISRPSRAPEQALLRVRRAGICGTDLHIFQGHLDHRIPKGGIIGHETFAEVVEAPADAGFRPGDRVVVEPIHSCGECRASSIAGDYLCYRLKIYGVELPGGMQDYWTVPASRMLHVPDTLADDQAAMVEPLAVATHAVRPAGARGGAYVRGPGGAGRGRRPDRRADRHGLSAPGRAGDRKRGESIPHRPAARDRPRG